MSKVKPWLKLGRERVLAEGYRRTLIEAFFKNPYTGEETRFIFYDQPNWSVILPLTEDGKVVTIRQYYHGRDKILQVLPGGDANLAKEKPEEVAKRELLEETGYQAQEIIYLGLIPLSVRSSRTYCFLFLALDCKKVEKPLPEEKGEIIEVKIVPLKDWIIRTLTTIEEAPSREATYLSLPYLIKYFPLELNEIFGKARRKK